MLKSWGGCHAYLRGHIVWYLPSQLVLVLVLCLVFHDSCQDPIRSLPFVPTMDFNVCAFSFRSSQCPWQQLSRLAELPLTLRLSLCLVACFAALPVFGWILWILQSSWTLWIFLSLSVLSRSALGHRTGPNYCFVLVASRGYECTDLFCILGTNPAWFLRLFDRTLGFPGEGPGFVGQSKLSVVTANIGSLKKNTFWSTCGDDIVCIQETRIGKNNVRSCSKDVEACGKKLFHGSLLPGILQSNGVVKSGSGGTAILACGELATPLSTESCTIYRSLYESKRVVAVWVQVAPQVRLLVFSIYAKTSASKFPEIQEENDHLLGQIFECAAQFGPVPVIVCGDFQLSPTQYHCVSAAVNHHSWIDPLIGVDDAGELFRPLTYSNDGLFTGQGERCTSIDGILCNHVAFSALRHIEVLELKVQHRPIRACFEWDRIMQVGFTLVKPAPFNLDQCSIPDSDDPLCPCHTNAVHLWTTTTEQAFNDASTVDDQWEIINRYFIQVITANGGIWEKGPKQRVRCRLSDPPEFVLGNLVKEMPFRERLNALQRPSTSSENSHFG